MLNKLTYVEQSLKALLGDPIVSIVTSDDAGMDTAIYLATVDYWTAFPFLYRSTFTTEATDSSPKVVTVDSLKILAFSDATVRENAYYLGITRIDESGMYNAPYISGIDSYLLGEPMLGIPDNTLDKAILNKTTVRTVTGTSDPVYDPISDSISLYLPNVVGSYMVDYAFGIDDATLDYVQPNRLKLFVKIAAKKYLEMILASRTAVDFQGDYTVSTSFVESKLSALTEELKDDLSKAALQPLIFG